MNGKRMSKFRKATAGDGEFCDWETNTMKGNKMGCCDCGLVHEVEFRIIKDIKNNGDGTMEAEIIGDDEDLKIQMRMRRDNRSTGQIRRHRK